MVSQPVRRAGSGIPLTRAASRVRRGEQVQLVLAEPEPCPCEREVRWPRNLLEPERLGVEAPRALDIRDDETNVLEAHRHHAYRNLASPRKEAQMPLIRVELFDYRMSDDTSAALIEKLTDALCEATHPGLRDHTWVIVEGHSPKNWGLGGKPWPVDQMPPAPSP